MYSFIFIKIPMPVKIMMEMVFDCDADGNTPDCMIDPNIDYRYLLLDSDGDGFEVLMRPLRRVIFAWLYPSKW